MTSRGGGFRDLGRCPTPVPRPGQRTSCTGLPGRPCEHLRQPRQRARTTGGRLYPRVPRLSGQRALRIRPSRDVSLRTDRRRCRRVAGIRVTSSRGVRRYGPGLHHPTGNPQKIAVPALRALGPTRTAKVLALAAWYVAAWSWRSDSKDKQAARYAAMAVTQEGIPAVRDKVMATMAGLPAPNDNVPQLERELLERI